MQDEKIFTCQANKFILALMEDFQIHVSYKKQDHLFTARLIQFGYSYKIEVEVNDSIIHFEKDDEGNWRALLSQNDLEQGKTMDKVLIGQISASIEEITK